MATIETKAIVVCDAGPLIHLDELDCLDLLADFAEILVPDAVWQEVVHHRPNALQHPSLAFKRLPNRAASPAIMGVAALFTLHRGELAALDIAREIKHALLLTDDTAARLAARTLQISVHGTVGLLIRAIRRQQRSRAEVLELLAFIPAKTSLFIKPSLLREFIQEVERL